MMAYIGLMRTRYVLFGFCLILMGCPAESDKTNDLPKAFIQQEIKDWQLQAQGDSSWTLTADIARQEPKGWIFVDLNWKSATSDLSLQSPEARQLKPKVYFLPNLTALGWQSQLKASNATFDLEHNQLTGQQLTLKGQTWSLEAKSFSAPLPLRKWKLNQVHGRFQR